MIALEGRVLAKMKLEMVPVMQEFLKKYIVFSKAETRDASADWVQLGLAGADAQALLDELFGESHERDRHCRMTPDSVVLTIPCIEPKYEVWLKSDTHADTLRIIQESAKTMNEERWNLLEIESGWAWVDSQTSNQYLPQMLNLQALGAISFTKGCYLGQEVVTRVHRLERVSRRLVRMAFSNNRPEKGDILHEDGKEVGKITSVVKNCDNFVAIGWLKSKIIDGKVVLDEGAIFVESLPAS
jgi:folate-binding protein YgfZ